MGIFGVVALLFCFLAKIRLICGTTYMLSGQHPHPHAILLYDIINLMLFIFVMNIITNFLQIYCKSLSPCFVIIGTRHQ